MIIVLGTSEEEINKSLLYCFNAFVEEEGLTVEEGVPKWSDQYGHPYTVISIGASFHEGISKVGDAFFAFLKNWLNGKKHVVLRRHIQASIDDGMIRISMRLSAYTNEICFKKELPSAVHEAC